MKSIRSLVRNTLLAAALASAPLSAAFAVPTFSFAPTGAHQAGSTFSVDVLASGLTDLYAYQFSVHFNPSLFRVLGVTEGGFLASGGSTFFDGGTIDNAAGQVSLTFDTLISAIAGVSGGGVLAHLDLQALNVAGSSVFGLTDVLALNSALSDIAITAQPITLVVPEPGTVALLALAAGAGVLVRTRRRTGRGDRATELAVV